MVTKDEKGVANTPLIDDRLRNEIWSALEAIREKLTEIEYMILPGDAHRDDPPF